MLELQNVSFQVPGDASGQKEIIKSINLKFQDHTFTAITGPNGGGKSTIARLLMGIIKETSGSVLLDGEDITKLSIDERAKEGIGFAFQQPPSFKGMTVRRLLNLAAGKELPEPVSCRLLSSVGLCAKEYLDREVDATLSGGEMKRIEIATVLARGQKLSVFDEPEAGIDLWSFNNLIRVFEGMRESINGSILIISHQERIMELADEIIVIDNGKVKERGSKAEILPHLMEQFSDNCAFKK